MHQQAERGDQHHLEPDIEVEQVAGQERAAHPAQAAAAAGDRSRSGARRSSSSICAQKDDDQQRSTERGQANSAPRHVGGEGDAEGRQPAAHGHGDRPVRMTRRSRMMLETMIASVNRPRQRSACKPVLLAQHDQQAGAQQWPARRARRPPSRRRRSPPRSWRGQVERRRRRWRQSPSSC